MRQYAHQDLTYTAYDKGEEGKGKQKNCRTDHAGPKRRNRSHEGKGVTSLSGLVWEGENSRRKKKQKGNTKRLRAFPPVS